MRIVALFLALSAVAPAAAGLPDALAEILSQHQGEGTRISGSDVSDFDASQFTVPPDLENRVKQYEHPKVDPRLLELADRARRDAPVGKQMKTLGFDGDLDRIPVRIVVEDASERERVVRQLQREGAEITVRFDEFIYVRQPPGAIDALKGMQGLSYAAPQPVYVPKAGDRGPVTSEGVFKTRVRKLHEAGVLGDGVKVGVLDFGFRRYGELRGRGEVPRPAAARPFNRVNRLQANTVHGTACAEIIHDMAPEAELYVAAIDGAEGQLVAAAKWLADQGVDIVSFSGGFHDAPHDGRAVLDQVVDRIVARYGLLWVNAAGNEARSHWVGQTADRNRNRFLDVDGARGDFLTLTLRRRSPVRILLLWDDWGGYPAAPAASQNLDLFMVAVLPNGRRVLVAHSVRASGPPLEELRTAPLPPGSYALLIRMTRVNRELPVRVLAQAPGGMPSITPSDPAGSVAIPGTARSALAVGAVDVRDDWLAPYSSRGPTDDGRVKPEVSAPTNARSLARGRGSRPGRFAGTSAACPHVSGFAALLKELHPRASRHTLSELVVENVQVMARPVPNNRFGHGQINASDVAVARQGSDPAGRSGHGDGDVEQELRDILGL